MPASPVNDVEPVLVELIAFCKVDFLLHSACKNRTRRASFMSGCGVFSNAGLHKTMHKVSARDTATLSRLVSSTNDEPREAVSGPEAHSETTTIAACWPWNLSTVPTRALEPSRYFNFET